MQFVSILGFYETEAANEEAYERLDNIEAAWLKKYVMYKKKTFMKQLNLRNLERMLTEKIVINEIVFKCRWVLKG